MKRKLQARGKTREKLLREAAALIRAHDRFAVFSHEEPDGDAIGCQVALALALRALGKRALALRADRIAPALEFLNQDGVVEAYDPARHDRELGETEVVVMVDCCDFFRLGRLEKTVRSLPGRVVNIDHHRDNAFFGDINYVRFAAGGAAELLYEVIRALGIRPSGRIAEAIYVGISTDTVNFRYIDPAGNMLAILGELLREGIDIEMLQEKLYCSYRDTYLEDLHRLLRTVRYELEGALAWFTMYRSEHLTFSQRELASEALRQLLSVGRVRAALMMHEEAAGVEVWLRSKRDVDVGKAAQALGGGGHQTAAGALLRGAGIEQGVSRVLQEVMARMGKRS